MAVSCNETRLVIVVAARGVLQSGHTSFRQSTFVCPKDY